MNFRDRVRAGADRERGLRGKLLRGMLADDKIAAEVEKAVRKQRGIAPNAAFDWSSIPWGEILTMLIPILLKMLVA